MKMYGFRNFHHLFIFQVPGAHVHNVFLLLRVSIGSTCLSVMRVVSVVVDSYIQIHSEILWRFQCSMVDT